MLGTNEHLLLPEFQQVFGVYVNVACQSGVDSAVKIHNSLKARQAKIAVRKYFYAILYQPIVSPNRPIYMASWARAIQPWTTISLIEFANTGKITAEDGKQFSPNHFELPKIISQGAHNCKFIDDLSKVKCGRDNLLHLAVKSKRSDAILRFFLLWNVSPSEIGENYVPATWLKTGANNNETRDVLSSHVSANRHYEMKQFMRANPRGIR